MAANPVRFRRVAAAFDEAAARVRLCESSGSEHSVVESPTDLSDLVASFLEREGRGQDDNNDEVNDDEVEGSCENKYWFYSEAKDVLEEICGSRGPNEDVDREKIRSEVENALKNVIGDKISKEFQRKLMVHLREKGFDAGICKSKWEKNGKYPAGDYQYIDVNINHRRHIVEVFLAGQFEIARPSARYAALLDLFPPVVVGRPEELKRLVRALCLAIKHSMNSSELLMPPWRRNAYMQSKWFSCYKRTTNKVPLREDAVCDIGFKANRAVGFQALPEISYGCRGDFTRKGAMKIGQLTETFGG